MIIRLLLVLLRFSHRECHRNLPESTGKLAGVTDSWAAAPELAGQLERFRQE